MSFILFLAAVAQTTAAIPSASVPPLADVAHAIAAGRLEQARLMIARAVAAGADQAAIDRLLADLAFASNKHREALARDEQILKGEPDKRELCEKAGLSALKLGEVTRAAPLVACAVEGGSVSWRAWNARGALYDHHGDWSGADRAYAQAAQLAPDRAEILNNQGWSRLLRGDWSGAERYLAKAAELAPRSERIANNLDLSRVGLEANLPERRSGESAEDWAHRLNDAGIAAQSLGNRQKAIAAFTRALEASETWYARAANNLDKAAATK